MLDFGAYRKCTNDFFKRVTVQNASSFPVYTKYLADKLYDVKIQLLPLDESDCCACFNYFFLRK